MIVGKAYILSSSDVRNIRSYVQQKYAGLRQEQHVEIVADAISRVIRRQLPAFEETVKHAVTADLIRLAVTDGQRPVGVEDIFGVCLALDLTEDSIYDPLHDWLERQLQLNCDKSHMRKVLNEVNEIRRNGGTGSLKQFKVLISDFAVATPVLEEPASLLGEEQRWFRLADRWRRSMFYLLLCLGVLMAMWLYQQATDKPRVYEPLQGLELQTRQEAQASSVDMGGGLPSELKFKAIDEAKLIAFLNKRQSVLAQQPYFDAIIGAAESFDINPLLLFAITGQEQGFVPTTNRRYKEIANNPFNVFHSWQDFNTTIAQSAEIAARTIVNRSKERPQGVDPLVWINETYAEDPKWGAGVRSILASLTEATQ
jgi:hypothetical protein